MRTLLAVYASAMVTIAGIPAEAAEQANAPRVVNVTSQSAPGWLPSEELERQALEAAGTYFSAGDSEDYDRAYAMMGSGMKGMVSRDQFTTSERNLRATLGPVAKRRIVKVTWTKDPPEPAPSGIYAAIDIVAGFQNANRYCGYLILYQAPGSTEFSVMRAESNFIRNAEFDAISAQKSFAEANALWAQLASHCPNYDAALN